MIDKVNLAATSAMTLTSMGSIVGTADIGRTEPIMFAKTELVVEKSAACVEVLPHGRMGGCSLVSPRHLGARARRW
jgi:hypothetical protein